MPPTSTGRERFALAVSDRSPWRRPDGTESLLFALVGYCGAHGIPLTLDERIGGRVPGTITPAGWTPGTRGTGLGSVRV